MTTQPPATVPVTENFNVHLQGTLNILSESIYTAGREVFVRELIQNGQDAITARRQTEPAFLGTVSMEFLTSGEGPPTLVVEDNGIGLTMEEARRALSTIAFSMKRPEDGLADDSPFVGRFGIGLLSGFLVADEITVITCRTGVDSVPVHWTGRINGTFTIHSAPGAMTEPGTRVYLRLREDAAREFEAKDVLETAQKYGRYLPHPVTFLSGGKTQLVTDEEPLWNLTAASPQMLEQGEEIFEVPMLSAFSFESHDAGAKGIAFIQAEPCHATAEATHVVFIKNMLVSERALDLEPPKAPFLRLFLNADRLRPNAGRDAVMSNDPRLPTLRRDVEAAMKKHLLRLQFENPALCAQIVAAQYRCLGELAEKDRAYLGLLVDWLPLETTLGRLTLGEIFKRHANKLEYVTDSTEFQRVQAKAHSEGHCIARVETERTHRLMELVSSAAEGKVRRISAGEYLSRFTKKAGTPSQREQLVIDLANKELMLEGCQAAFYDTDEPDEVARLDMGTQESLDRLLGMEPKGEDASKKLLMNRRHTLVSQMIGGAADEALLRVWIRVLYQFALLEAREVPTLSETRRFSRALGNAFTASSLGSL